MKMPDAADRKGFSLRRWSQRKHAAARSDSAADPACVGDVTPVGQKSADLSSAIPLDASVGGVAAVPSAASSVAPVQAPAGTASATATSDAVLPLPPLESLTIDSDYSPFMRPGVDDAMKRGALKKLFSDPRFNVMDGLDVYIADYSIPDPIDPAVVRTLTQARYIFNPPATRVNAAGYVEDVPDDGTVDAAGDADAAGESPVGETAVAQGDASATVPTSAREAVARIDAPAVSASVDADGTVVAATPVWDRT
jgi:hypothetical protein